MGEVGSRVCGAGVLAATYGLARSAGVAERPAWLAVVVTAASGDLAFYASSGLETALFAGLVAVALAGAMAGSSPERRGWRWPVLAGVLALTVLARPEGVLVVGFVLGLRLLETRDLAAAIRLGVATLLLLAPVLVLKRLYHGDWLPNTYYAKSHAGLANAVFGLRYVLHHGGRYAPLALVAIALALRGREMRRAGPLLVFAGGWVLYVIGQGGDNMVGARVLVPALAPLAVALSIGVSRLDPRMAVAAAVLIAVGQVASFAADASVRTQLGLWRQHFETRRAAGLHIRDRFVPDASVALNPAGVIPYFAERTAIDMLGLNDAHIARRGKRDRSLPLRTPGGRRGVRARAGARRHPVRPCAVAAARGSGERTRDLGRPGLPDPLPTRGVGRHRDGVGAGRRPADGLRASVRGDEEVRVEAHHVLEAIDRDPLVGAVGWAQLLVLVGPQRGEAEDLVGDLEVVLAVGARRHQERGDDHVAPGPANRPRESPVGLGRRGAEGQRWGVLHRPDLDPVVVDRGPELGEEIVQGLAPA